MAITRHVKAIVYKYEMLFIDLSQQLSGHRIPMRSMRAILLSDSSGRTL
jgi:hypothetical protein